VNQISGTTHTDAPAQPHEREPAEHGGTPSESPGFQSRGRARRRARFLRKARELAYRDLGGLVFNLHRFGQRNDALVLAKLTTLAQIDDELRAIESTLGERQSITVLREAGITACPRCAAIHGSEDSFCPNCGLSLGRHVDLPIAGAPAAQSAGAPGASSPPPAPTPAATPTPTPAPAPTPTPPPAPAAGAPPAPASQPAATDRAGVAPAATTPSGPVVPQSGRSPSPPGGASTRSPAPDPVPAVPRPPVDHDATVIEKATTAVEDGPTEIVRPPASDS
jgi:hypothetical protein